MKIHATFVTTATLLTAQTAADRSNTMLDGADTNPNTHQGFSRFFVADVRAHDQHDRHWSASVGVDSALERDYFLFHPLPPRSFVRDAKDAF